MIEIKGGGGLWNSIFGGDDGVSLRSKAILKVLFLLSEGEIPELGEGEDFRKYLYISNTAVMNPDGTENFRGVKVDFRRGTQFQNAIPGMSQGAAAPVTVGVKVSNSAGAVTRTINSPLAGQVRIALTTPGLSYTNDDGFVKNSEVRFKIYLSTNGSPFVEKVNDRFFGRTQGGYARDYTIDLTGVGPWQVRIERTSPDPALSDTKTQNELYWQAFTPIVEQKFRYPNSALLYIAFDSALFKSQPTVVVKAKGVISRIPNNYNPITRTYSGLWNGQFTRAWTNNPAWCLLELLTNTRFGLGSNIDIDKVDKWSLYQMAVYCDQKVDNGFGGLESRFTYNAYLNTKTDAFAAINAILGQIRGAAYYAGGQVFFSQDRPGILPVDIYTQSNTICEYDEDGVLTQPNFTYDYVSLKEKNARCHVFWYDPNEFDKKKTAYVDLFDIGYGDDFYRYGDEVKEVDLPGCTSEAEARRHGRWLLLTERLQSKTVTFATGEDGIIRFPGDLIRIVDTNEVGNRIGGKVVEATDTTVTLDADLNVGFVVSEISVLIAGSIITKQVSNIGATSLVLTVSTPFDTIPNRGDTWFVNIGIDPEVYKIISISNPSIGKYGMVGVLYKDKFAEIDKVESLTVEPPSNTKPEPLTNVVVTSVPSGYLIGWAAPISVGTTEYKLEYEELNSGYWQPIVTSPGATDARVVLPAGSYRFRVAATNIYGKTSEWAYSALNYSTSGSIFFLDEDGSLGLGSEIQLLPNVEYFLDTFCAKPAGNSSPGLPNPYADRRKISTPTGTPSKVFTSPSYLGDTRLLVAGSYRDIEMYNPITYIKLTAGTAILYSGVNFTGTPTSIVAGTYVNAGGQLPPRSVVVSGGGTLRLAQHQPSTNPVPYSTWRLTTDPLEAITASGDPLFANSSGSTSITL